MTDAKSKETPLFSDDLPAEEKSEQTPAEPGPTEIPGSDNTSEVPVTPPAEENPDGQPAAPPQVDETFEPAKDIFEAIQRKEMNAVLAFLENKSNLSATNQQERTPLQIAAAVGSLEIVKLLVERGANTEAPGKDGRTALMLALSDCHFDVAEYLLSKGVKVNVSSTTNYTPLMQAAAKGATEIVRTMLPKIDDVNAHNNEGRTALMIAVRFGHRDIVEMLLARNASLQSTDTHGNTVASFAESPDLKKYLSERAEAERRLSEERKKEKEETVVEEVKRSAPSIFIVVGIILATTAFGYLAYYQFQKTRIRKIEIPPFVLRPAETIAGAYCSRLAECREGASTDLAKRCLELATPRFGEMLASQRGTSCDQNRIATCASCLSGLICDRAKKLEFDYLESNCKSCFKACDPVQ